MSILNRTYERNAVGRLGNVVGNAQQKYGEREQNGNAERNLFTGVWRQIEHEQCKKKKITMMMMMMMRVESTLGTTNNTRN